LLVSILSLFSFAVAMKSSLSLFRQNFRRIGLVDFLKSKFLILSCLVICQYRVTKFLI